MKKLRTYLILIILTLTLSYISIGFVFSKYYSVDKININLNVTPRPQYEMTGSNHDVIFEKNTKSEITVSMVPGSSIHERIYIPLDTIEVGLYQLSFDVIMETESPYDVIIDNTLYVYGCTVGSNEMLDLGDDRYLWKSITPLEKEHVDLAFWATEEDVANGNVTWVWNWGNIRDNYRSRIYLTNIEVEKIPTPTGAYIDFPHTQLIFLQHIDGARYSHQHNITKETVTTDPETGEETTTIEYEYIFGNNMYHPAKGTFIRQATYSEYCMSMETLGNHETFDVPIKNLVIGNTYKIKFDLKRTFINFYTNGGKGYGCYVAEEMYTGCGNRHSEQVVYFTKNEPEKANNEFTFTATAETMYWIWQGGTLMDGEWFTMWLNNVSITQV